MKSLNSISALALVAALIAMPMQAEAKSSTTKKVLIGAGAGVAAGAAGMYLMNKMSAKKSAEETTASIRPKKPVAADDDDDEEDDRPVRRTVKRGVDQTTTGSVSKASYRESCTVRAVDLFDKKGVFVKAERMRVCQ